MAMSADGTFSLGSLNVTDGREWILYRALLAFNLSEKELYLDPQVSVVWNRCSVSQREGGCAEEVGKKRSIISIAYAVRVHLK